MSSSTERREAARTLSLVWVVLVLGVLATGWLLTGPLASVVDPWDDSVVRWLEDHRTPDLDTAAAAVLRDEAEALVSVEPLDGALSHDLFPLFRVGALLPPSC